MNQIATHTTTKPVWQHIPLVLLVFAASCSGSRTVGSATHATAVSLGANNLVLSQVTNSHIEGDGTSTLIVKGKNNIISYRITDSDIRSYNSKTLTIIEGNNNNISTTITKCILLYRNRTDTVIIKGNQLRIDFKAENIKQLIVGPTPAPVVSTLRQLPATSKANGSSQKTADSGSNRTHHSTRGVTPTSLDKVEVTALNNSNLQGVLAIDTTDKTFDWSTTESATRLTGEEKVYVAALDKSLPLLAAMAYYTKQAQGSNYEACYQLGLLYDSQSFSVLTDLPRAMRYYELAARHNHGAAAFRLGQLYELGDFEFSQVVIDQARAKYYYSLAAQNGNAEAAEKLKSWPN